MTPAGPPNRAFKKALYISAAAHALLLLLIIVNPSLPKSNRPGEIRYISLGSFSGGGGGGGGNGGMRGPAPAAPTIAETKLPAQTLHDLTTIQKLKEQPPPSESSLRYPVEKSKRSRTKAKPDKVTDAARTEAKAKPSEKPAGNPAGGTAGPGGAALSIGAGGPGFGEGSNLGGYGGQIGMGNFPFSYYTQNIQDRISARWFQSLVDPGVAGTFHTTVYFRIFRNGTISDVDVKESSGIPSLDLSAKRAVITAAPFPPLPPEYDEKYLGIILIFEHSK